MPTTGVAFSTRTGAFGGGAQTVAHISSGLYGNFPVVVVVVIGQWTGGGNPWSGATCGGITLPPYSGSSGGDPTYGGSGFAHQAFPSGVLDPGVDVIVTGTASNLSYYAAVVVVTFDTADERDGTSSFATDFVPVFGGNPVTGSFSQTALTNDASARLALGIYTGSDPSISPSNPVWGGTNWTSVISFSGTTAAPPVGAKEEIGIALWTRPDPLNTDYSLTSNQQQFANGSRNILIMTNAATSRRRSRGFVVG